ncbi:hypothetical protein ACJJTC_001884 [Scirpophaga incertulas]
MGADVVFQVLLPQESSACTSVMVPPNSQQPTSCCGVQFPHLINTQFGYIIGGTLPMHIASTNVCNKLTHHIPSLQIGDPDVIVNYTHEGIVVALRKSTTTTRTSLGMLYLTLSHNLETVEEGMVDNQCLATFRATSNCI